MNRNSKKYYREIKTLIPSRGKYEKRLLKNYKERILELNKIQSDITYEELQKNLGTPTEIIHAYYENVDTTYLIKRLQITQTVRTCVYCILFVLLFSFCISLGLNLKTYHQASDSIITHEQTIIK